MKVSKAFYEILVLLFEGQIAPIDEDGGESYDE